MRCQLSLGLVRGAPIKPWRVCNLVSATRWGSPTNTAIRPDTMRLHGNFLLQDGKRWQVYRKARIPTSVQAMETNATINDSPAMKPDATGTENVSTLGRCNLVHSQTMVAPMANDSEFWKTITLDWPSAMEDGSQHRAFGNCFSHTGSETPMSEQI